MELKQIIALDHSSVFRALYSELFPSESLSQVNGSVWSNLLHELYPSSQERSLMNKYLVSSFQKQLEVVQPFFLTSSELQIYWSSIFIFKTLMTVVVIETLSLIHI
eukprot:TRINITY_DN11047_c0_g4_i2.p1 TRINITY_DN11047_c0_g4~~TRINITY_DN11047_c0_g4_i2.p1  ORF type:complete len:106 (+),score=2.85 TRINITY_DN11047_c0_g4_i2:327-644(+)